MTTTRVNADSLLAVDVGGITTRAMLFDDVDGRYRFLAIGSASTTANAPFNDVQEGIRMAIERLQAITGRVLVGADERLIVPSRPDGTGIDTVAATLSAGSPLKIMAIGLLEDISLESAQHLATTTYARVVESIGLNDRRVPEERIDAILRIRPDLIVAAGGTDGGASHSVIKLLEAVGLASYMLPEEQKLEVLYVGNQQVKDEIKATFGNLSNIHFAPNVRPTLEMEQLEPAQVRLADIARRVRGKQINGVVELDSLAGGGLLPTATAFGRVIRYLSKVYKSDKGVLGVDIGASATTIAVGIAGELKLGVYPYYGLGNGLTELLDHCSLGEITRWLHLEIPDSYVRQYLFNKALYPGSLPATDEDLAVEQSLARQAIRLSFEETISGSNGNELQFGSGVQPWFEPVVASGSVLTRAPTHAQSLLLLLDGLQPTGVTTLVLDQNHLAPALGAAAAINPILTSQVLDSSTFLNLGTVVSPVGEARPGTPILRMRMKYEGGNETSLEVKMGTVEMLHLPIGQPAQLHLQPLHRFDVGMGGAGRGGSLRVVGGALGVVIDARGRPIQLPADPAKRRETINKWRWSIGC
jgi:MutL protein